jgi:hypothetical protein
MFLKQFLKIFISVVFINATLFANDFRDVQELSLKKDEQIKFLVKYAKQEKLFKMRWTLYKNNGLVIHRSYDNIVAQNILYNRNKNRSFRLELKPRGADFYNVPYILVQFKKFDFKKHEAMLELYLSDDKGQINLKHLKK